MDPFKRDHSPYVCGPCGTTDREQFLRCNRGDCPDGHDQCSGMPGAECSPAIHNCVKRDMSAYAWGMVAVFAAFVAVIAIHAWQDSKKQPVRVPIQTPAGCYVWSDQMQTCKRRDGAA